MFISQEFLEGAEQRDSYCDILNVARLAQDASAQYQHLSVKLATESEVLAQLTRRAHNLQG